MEQSLIKKAKPTPSQLKKAVNLIFEKYDNNCNGYLDQQSVIKLLNDSLLKQGKTERATKSHVHCFLKKCDQNHNGKIQKQQLFQFLNDFLSRI